MYLISAYFDKQTEKQLQRFIDTVANLSGNTYMLDEKVPPHLTISAFETRNPVDLTEDFYRLEKMEKGPVNIISTGQFFPYVMFCAPVINEYLSHLSESVYDIFKERKELSISKCYKPLSWFPHITLGKKLTEEQMRKTFEGMQRHFLPLNGQIVALGLAKTNPHKDIARIELK